MARKRYKAEEISRSDRIAEVDSSINELCSACQRSADTGC